MNATISKMRDRMNAHDPDGFAALFSPAYRSEQPAHPNRGFDGHAQVAANWGNVFRGVPDLRVDVLADIDDGTTSWSEWRWYGHHADGSPFEMRGITVMGLTEEGLIAEARLYMEPVEQGGSAIQESVRHLTEPAP